MVKKKKSLLGINRLKDFKHRCISCTALHNTFTYTQKDADCVTISDGWKKTKKGWKCRLCSNWNEIYGGKK